MSALSEPIHGTVGAYTNAKCRCDECRKAWNTYCKNYRYRTGRNVPIEERLNQRALAARALPHGSESKYQQGCRCDKCRRAATDARWRRRMADPEAYAESIRRDDARKRAKRLSLDAARPALTTGLPSEYPRLRNDEQR